MVKKYTYFEDNELDDNAKTQLLTKKRNILVHYTKLFTYGLIPIIDIAGIFRFFIQVRLAIQYSLTFPFTFSVLFRFW